MPWNDYADNTQHNAISPAASQPLNHILWQTPVDLNPQYSGTELLIHYGSPLITRSNTVIVPVKIGATDGFRVEAHTATNGVTKAMIADNGAIPIIKASDAGNPIATAGNRFMHLRITRFP